MWADKETDKDYLNFGYLVNLVTEIAADRSLTPSTIGLYGDWGSGKSSLMKLAQAEIELRAKAKEIAENCKGDMALAKQISSVLAPSINGNLLRCK